MGWRYASVALLATLGCGAPASAVSAPVRYAVDVPAPGAEPPADPDAAKVPREAIAPECPPGSSREDGQCVRIVASPEIPQWKPSFGADPCATTTSETGLVDCDPKNEHPPDPPAAGSRPHAR
jgi:hypothetical protein